MKWESVNGALEEKSDFMRKELKAMKSAQKKVEDKADVAQEETRQGLARIATQQDEIIATKTLQGRAINEVQDSIVKTSKPS